MPKKAREVSAEDEQLYDNIRSNEEVRKANRKRRTSIDIILRRDAKPIEGDEIR